MYSFSRMNQEMAEEIAFNWKYDGDYSFYDMTEDKEDLEEFLHSDRKGYFVVRREEEIIGFFCFVQSGSNVDIGLGMKPEITGKGLGLEFFQNGLEFARDHYGTAEFSLSVAQFNKRAIRVYQKAGFIQVKTFMQETNGSTYEFVKMTNHGRGE
ncbi:GNAT family N-acetyltransferase [Rossellomorea vietnamensis]|uniref:GNAT family N-acetyltransferase n=1 Tax=Rossellomorea vietnamensis TaxID=218284 RepID=A0A5D4MIL1_9BACI|nr:MULTISPECIES: GNAT family N-acetyltransferase [Bacillaceae]TYS01408.1 GNAT family N-acetyltransferase [Rossellomorea vietnamensis]